jgi:hypothetical protein
MYFENFAVTLGLTLVVGLNYQPIAWGCAKRWVLCHRLLLFER